MSRSLFFIALCGISSSFLQYASANLNCAGLRDINYPSSQMLIVNGQPGSITKATIQSCEKVNGTWMNFLPTFDAVVGSNGISQPREREEGDNLTPSGTFGIGEFFGWTPTSDPVVQQFKWDYRYIVDVKDQNGVYFDKFVDDSDSPYYNSWVAGPTTAKSFEQMHISAYKYGLVINYNMYPTIPVPLPTTFLPDGTYLGKGSAIFLHIWSGPDGSTAGCVALDEGNLITILQWLDKKKQPHIKIIAPVV